jgi:hypothetical protein
MIYKSYDETVNSTQTTSVFKVILEGLDEVWTSSIEDAMNWIDENKSKDLNSFSKIVEYKTAIKIN